MTDSEFLEEAITLSKQSIEHGGFPVGVVIAQNGELLSSGVSNGKFLNDPTSHAEIAAIREACLTLQTRGLKDTVLYSSLEPCLMCFAASTWASIPKIVYACGRKRVSEQHYEGDHELAPLNAAARRPLQLIHLEEFEEAALKVINDWEKSLGQNLKKSS